jgi:hypothetical protein
MHIHILVHNRKTHTTGLQATQRSAVVHHGLVYPSEKHVPNEHHPKTVLDPRIISPMNINFTKQCIHSQPLLVKNVVGYLEDWMTIFLSTNNNNKNNNKSNNSNQLQRII